MSEKILHYEIETLNKTGYASPSQWEAIVKGGTPLYIRYRWGRLTVQHLYREGDEIVGLGDAIYSKVIGGEYDGTMTTDEMLAHLA